MINEIQKAKQTLTGAAHKIETLTYENQQLKAMLYRMIDKHGGQIENKEIPENVVNFRFLITESLEIKYIKK